MIEGEITSIILWTHLLYDLLYLGSHMYKHMDNATLRAGSRLLGQRIEKVIEKASARPGALLVLIEPEFKEAAPGAVRAYRSIKRRCLKEFKDRVVVLPPEAGYYDIKGFQVIKEGLEPFKGRFPRDKKIRLFYTGETPGICSERARDRVADALKEIAGIIIPKERQHEMKRFSIKSGHSFREITPIIERLKRKPKQRPGYTKPRK